MSADTLRRAAATLRADSQTTAGGEPCEPDEFGLAVADLLDAVDRAARLAGVAADHPEALSIREKALAIANAYLQETP